MHARLVQLVNGKPIRHSHIFDIDYENFFVSGTEFNFEYLSGKLAVFHILFFGLLLNNYYMAAVVSVRVKTPITKINDSLNELKKLDMICASQSLIYTDYYLKVKIVSYFHRNLLFLILCFQN